MVAELKEKYRGRVSFSLRHFPLDFHKEADESAIAIECVREQGPIEAFHRFLFNNQRAQKVSDLKRYARQARLPDLAKFDRCLDARKYQNRVDLDMQAGNSIGVTGTPAVLIGRVDHKLKKVTGVLLIGARGRSTFEEAIEKFLKAKGQ